MDVKIICQINERLILNHETTVHKKSLPHRTLWSNDLLYIDVMFIPNLCAQPNGTPQERQRCSVASMTAIHQEPQPPLGSGFRYLMPSR